MSLPVHMFRDKYWAFDSNRSKWLR